MKEIQLSKEEFENMFYDLAPNLRVVMNEIGIGPYDSKEERLAKIKKAFNPEIPRYIDMHTADGLIRYSIKK